MGLVDVSFSSSFLPEDTPNASVPLTIVNVAGGYVSPMFYGKMEIMWLAFLLGK